MAKSIDQAYINTYETNVRHLAQQSIQKFRPWVQSVNEQSEAHNWETLDSLADIAVETKAAGLVATPDNDEVWAKRRTNIITKHIGNSIQQEDIVQMLVDPNSALVRAQSMAMARAVDDIIIEGATKDASVKGSGAPVAFPVSQVLGDGTTPITFDFVTEVLEKFNENDIDPDEQKVWFIGPKQCRKLLQLTEATSADYNAMRPLQDKGYVESWMGFKWILSTRLNLPAGGEIDNLIFTKRALGLHVAKDITTRVGEDVTNSFAWRVYSYLSMDCVRVEDKHIVRAHLLDSI